MKFLVVLVAVVAAVAAMDGDNEAMMKAAAMKVLTMDVKDMHSCNADADCAAHPNMPVCCKQFKLCKPTTSPSMEMEYGTCENDMGCRPVYRCKDKKCHFSGPKACNADTDCLQGITGMTYECKELAKSAPGKRCYPKCAADRDCYGCEGDKCKISPEAQEKLGCCQGNCQKKAACM